MQMPARATYSITVSGTAQAAVGTCSVVKHGVPLVLARCTRRRALVQLRTRRTLVQQRTLLVLARCTRQRALTGAGAAQVPAGATYSITVSSSAYAVRGRHCRWRLTLRRRHLLRRRCTPSPRSPRPPWVPWAPPPSSRVVVVP